jgi:hypothetical protein
LLKSQNDAKGTKLRRRDLFRVTIAVAGTAVAAIETLAFEAVAAESTGSANKRKARYQANSAEVKDFYRVNRYPARSR